MIATNLICQYSAQREAYAQSAYVDGKGVSLGLGIFGAKLGDTVEYDEGLRLFQEHWLLVDEDMAAVFADFPFTQQQYDGVADIAYNLGRTQLLRESELLDAVADLGEVLLKPPHDDPKEQKKIMRRAQDKVAATFPRVKFNTEEDRFHNLSRKMTTGAVFLTGTYGDLTFLKLWIKGQTPGVDKPLLVKMPTFRGA